MMTEARRVYLYGVERGYTAPRARAEEAIPLIEAEAVTAALTALRAQVDGLRMIGSAMPWPARCADCGMATEDPDAFVIVDEEIDHDRALCPKTDHEHRWMDYRAAVLSLIDAAMTGERQSGIAPLPPANPSLIGRIE